MRVSLPRASDRLAGVTAVIPCYNYGHYLPQAVASVLEQPGVDPRVIIVDDHSTDDSLEVARALAAADERVTVVEHSVNRGHIITYNDGLDAVVTEYVTLISADDLVAPGALGRAVALMNAHPRVGMVYGQPVEFTDAPPTSDRDGAAPYTWTRWSGHAWIRLATARGRSFILSPEVVMRTAVVEQIGGYTAALPKSGDLEYWLRTAARWDVGRINGRVQAFYRQHTTNMHKTELPTMALDLHHRLLAMQYLESEDYLEVSPKGARFVERARIALAREGIALALREIDTNGRAELVDELRAAALEIDPGIVATRRLRLLDLRMRQNVDGAEPTRRQRRREQLRSLADRARWRWWVYTGVS